MARALIDSFGRTIDYLRISVTDRCNFRCLYCMPTEGIPILSRGDILSFEEITRVARIFLSMGGKKLKLTGGEPLTRKDIEVLVTQLAHLDGLEDLGLSTNGFHLKELAPPLFKAGLKRVNVSLDSMNPSRFAKLTCMATSKGPLLGWKKVWEGIQKALQVGLQLKINVVVMKGITDEELTDFGKLAQEYPVAIRFIEFMPLCGTGWHPEWMLPLKTIEDFFREHYDLLLLRRGSSTAKTYQLKEGKGKIGFIASMTEPFCDHCSRLRLTADGKLRPCLFSNEVLDLKNTLRHGATDEEIEGFIKEAIWKKPKGHGISPQIPTALELPRIRAFGG